MTASSLTQPRRPSEYLGDTHELLTREGTDGVLHYGLQQAACGATPRPDVDISLVSHKSWVDCADCKARIAGRPGLTPV